ncbi:hypothetical protein [Pusillimonas noertemannii]|uniref:hypothetical protein n=1 Tax=Pusillimonas noertemannii TaxID=305977 RepID=UPI00031C4E61|nr:hypothetical protein [Pusillimonas noertemannii]NYT68918.1 hypothetical protein [Pusillimonas noertemannii]
MWKIPVQSAGPLFMKQDFFDETGHFFDEMTSGGLHASKGRGLGPVGSAGKWLQFSL